MTSRQSKTRIEGVLESILRRASYDKAFRALALSDVDGLFEKFGVSLPTGHKIRFTEGADVDENSISLPPLMQISLQDAELKVIVGDKDLKLARYENWSADRLRNLFKGVAYENWGSE